MSERYAVAEGAWRLSCEGVGVQRGPRRVLDEVSLEIGAGDCVTIIGPNGSGKTTLLLTLLGLLRPAAGRVLLNDQDIHRLSPRRRARFAAYVPQSVERLPAFRVYDVVAGGRFPHVSPLRPLSAEDRDVIEHALERCRIRDVAERPVHSISGGERQKTLLAAAIAQDAAALFLDEPTTALDPAIQVDLIELLHDWHGRGRAVIVVSHDLNLPLALGGKIVALQGGRVAAAGEASEILVPERLGEIYGTSFATAVTADGKQALVPRWWGVAADD